MSLRLQNFAWLAALAVFVGSGPLTAGAIQPSEQQVNIHVDCVCASDTNEGIDTRLASSMGQRLHALFGYSTYHLVSHQHESTPLGKAISFELPGGRILHVEPHAIDGDMIAMMLVLFQGARPLMTTDVKLRDNGMLILGGPRYQQGMLIVSISADAPKLPTEKARSIPPTSASASAVPNP
jgi:hypothetical protein